MAWTGDGWPIARHSLRTGHPENGTPGRYKDLFREKNPDAQTFSWWDYRAGAFHKRQGLRIDLLLANAALVERVSSVHIDRDFRKKRSDRIPSDHAPVIAELREAP